MNKLTLILPLFITAALPAPAFADEETAYERVTKTQTIRCGWGANDPWIYKDLETGEIKGVNAEIAKAVAERLELELQWPEETGWGNLPHSLYSGRVDVACSTLWNDPVRGKRVAYTRPIFFSAIYAYARADDDRFSGDLREINRPEIKIVVQEGDVTSILARRRFPEAKTTELSSLASWADVYLTVTTGKADITFGDPISVAKFNAANDNALERIPFDEPLTVYGNALAVSIHETELRDMLDNTIAYMIQTGEIGELTRDFRTQYPHAIVLPAKPYEYVPAKTLK